MVCGNPVGLVMGEGIEETDAHICIITYQTNEYFTLFTSMELHYDLF